MSSTATFPPTSGLAQGATRSFALPSPFRLQGGGDVLGTRLRLHILASEVILATELPQGLSVRNAVAGILERLDDESNGLIVATIAVGNARLLARITRSAVDDLALTTGRQVWALVKAASLTLGVYRPL